MNQVEIAKKILEQSNCLEIGCEDDNCPFYKYDLSIDTDCLISVITTEKIEDGKDMDKVKQWLKERESMIDLTRHQILAEPVKCWVKYDDEWEERWLIKIGLTQSQNLYYETISGLTHNSELNICDIALRSTSRYSICTLTDPAMPTKKIKKWERVEDVPVELWGNALCKYKNEHVRQASILTPFKVTNMSETILQNMVYLPLGQPLTSEWLPFKSEE